MKTSTLKVLVFLYLIQCSYSTLAQSHKWDFGVSASAGKEFYHRTIYGPPLGPGATYNFESIKSWGAGVFAERHLSSKFSLITKIEYSTQTSAPTVFFGSSWAGNVWYKEQRDHRTMVGVDFRGYLVSKSSFKVFAQTGIAGDYFLGYSGTGSEEKTFNWNAKTFKRFVTGYSAGLGVQWKRLGLMAEYHGNIGKGFYRKALNDDLILMKRESIYRKGYSVKATFIIFKGRD